MPRLDELGDYLREHQRKFLERQKMWVKRLNEIEELRKVPSFDPWGEVILGLISMVIKEANGRETDDMTLLEIVTFFISEQNKDIVTLRKVIAPLVTKEKSLSKQLESIEKRVQERLEFDEKLDELLKEWKQSREKTQEAMEKAGFYH